jgi:hypothetical protein
MISYKTTVSIVIVIIIVLITRLIDAKSVKTSQSAINKNSNEEKCNDSVRILNAKQIIKQLTNMLQNELKNLHVQESADVKKNRKIIQINLLMKLKNLKSNCT